jgi:hypothetical protein
MATNPDAGTGSGSGSGSNNGEISGGCSTGNATGLLACSRSSACARAAAV